MFPGLVVPLVISETEYTQMLDDAIMRGHLIGAVCRKELPSESEDAISFFDVGVTAQVLKMLRFPDGSVRILIKGQDRFKINRMVDNGPPPLAEIEIIETQYLSEVKEEALIRTLKELLQKLTEKVNYLPEDLLQTASHAENASSMIDIIAANLKVDTGAKQLILETFDVMKRLRLIVSHIRKEIEVVDIAAKIKDDAAAEINKSQREFILREQMKAIQRELGETDDRNAEIEEYRRKMEEAGLTDAAREAAEQELERFARMNAAAAEYSVSRNYLDWLVSLPWNKGTEDNLDIPVSQQILDEDHYGLEKIKERILEYLAVRKLNPNIKGPILCFVGPPGVGKTSLGKSIARAMNRKFYRMSLGGVRDEAEIRGHRRTYVGSMPGRLIQAMRKVKSNNPVIMLDELDKLGNDFRGDPASALLEVLDPEQNWSFSDHYLEVPFDLSKAFFIGTANLLEPVPPALKDRMEVVYLSGYTDIEKLAIAKSYLIPQEMQNHGLTAYNIQLSDKAIMKLMDDYTREAGLRNLKREIGSICRKVARVVAEGRSDTVKISPQKVRKFLGPERFTREILLDKSRIGIVPGLAWTSVGGDVLYIEATKMPGNKHLTLTGQIGNVMKESMQAALSYIRSKSPVWDIDPEMFEVFDFHIHVPAGATPKDGPSAGITIATALLSILTERPVKPQLAMTGEITLRGDVLPIGGLKEKSLAAYRLGIKTILFPQSNEKDLDEVPREIRSRINFIPLSCVDDVFEHALDKES
ncbi:MAG: endopeptidase La [candidate division Zixibacteria bacterium]|nr:endopeptidase La [candidate division Zixibacteria bacterium]